MRGTLLLILLSSTLLSIVLGAQLHPHRLRVRRDYLSADPGTSTTTTESLPTETSTTLLLKTTNRPATTTTTRRTKWTTRPATTTTIRTTPVVHTTSKLSPEENSWETSSHWEPVGLGQLNEAENERRANDCGRWSDEEVSYYYDHSHLPCLVPVTYSDGSNNHNASGFFISDRHVLTVSSAVFPTGFRNTTSDGKQAPNCEDGIVRIPSEAIRGIRIFAHRRVVSAAYIGHCGKTDDEAFGLTLLEVEESFTDGARTPMCVPDKPTDNFNKTLVVYSVSHHSRLNEVDYDSNPTEMRVGKCSGMSICTTGSQPLASIDVGGALVKDINGKETAVGLIVTASPGTQRQLKLSRLSRQICQVSGVCPRPRNISTWPPTFATTTPATTPTEASTPTTRTTRKHGDVNTSPTTTASSPQTRAANRKSSRWTPSHLPPTTDWPKLDYKEAMELAHQCGKKSGNPWMAQVDFPNHGSRSHQSAFTISKRHVVTSSDAIFTHSDNTRASFTWLLDGQDADLSQCYDGILEVPYKIVKQFKVRVCGSKIGKDCQFDKEANVTRAVYMGNCDRTIHSYGLVLLETDHDVHDSYDEVLCTAGVEKVRYDEPAIAYELGKVAKSGAAGKVIRQTVTFEKCGVHRYNHPELSVCVNGNIGCGGDFGGPLTISEQSPVVRHVAVGVLWSYGCGRPKSSHISLEHFYSHIHNLIGLYHYL